MKPARLLIPLALAPHLSPAAVPGDGRYEVLIPTQPHPAIEIRHGEIIGAEGSLPILDCRKDASHTQLRPTDLADLFPQQTRNAPLTGTIVKQGEGHYLLASSLRYDQPWRFTGIKAGTLLTARSELVFDTPSTGSLKHRTATAFFSGEGAGMTTCLGKIEYEVNRIE